MDDIDLAERLTELLKVLANPIRLKILALCLFKERTSRELREKLRISKPLLISHLRKLVNMGLLDYRTELDEERMIVRKYYRTRSFEICINSEVLKEIFEDINNNYIYATSTVPPAATEMSAKIISNKLRKRREEKEKQKEFMAKIRSLEARASSLAIGASYVKSILSQARDYVKSKNFSHADATISHASQAIRELESIGKFSSRWRREGYFFAINESNLKTIKEDYERVKRVIERIRRIEEELKTIQFLEIPEINALYTKIKNNLKDLSKIDEVERDFATLKQMVEERRKLKKGVE